MIGMKTYEVKARFTEITSGRAWLTVEAESEKEALEKAENHEFIGLDYKSDSSDDFTIDMQDLEITELNP
jgi:hypothetical protein